MLLDRLAQQPGDPGRRGKRDRQAIAAKFLAHRMSGVVDLLADAISGAADKRGRCKGVASNAELALEFAALEHRAPRGVAKAGAGRKHHSPVPPSSIRAPRRPPPPSHPGP